MRSVQKSRNGCARCKGQRLKCDETKPECGRCVRVGVECPGYIQPLKWSTKYEKHVNRKKRQTKSPAEASAQSQPSSAAISGNLVMDDIFSLDMNEWMLSGFTIGDSPFTLPDIGTELAVPLSPPESDVQPAETQDDVDVCTDAAVDEEVSHQPVSRSTPMSFSVLLDVSHSTSLQSRSLCDTSSILTEFYFKEAASLYSVYDSQMNPFRSAVSQLWDSSRLIHCTLQSMAAACLTDSFPHLAPIGKSLRNEAISILQSQQDEFDHASLLALLMLGGSSGWHDSKDLGLQFFNLARKRLDHMALTGRLPRESNNYHFFEEALVYWELLLAYVADTNALDASAPPGDFAVPTIYSPSRHVPHPWTGVARDTQVTVQEVGRLVRRCRNLAHSKQFVTQATIDELRQASERGKQLEERLLSFMYPDEKDVVSPGDRDTPIWHLLTLAEVYRRTGLAQLYRVFPDLLRRRLSADATAQFDTSVLSFDLFSDDADAAYPPVEPAGPQERQQHNEWLTRFTLTTLNLLKSIPLESGTRDFQPFLLVASCSELAFSSPELQAQDGPLIQNQPPLSLHMIEVTRTRQFVLDRLTSFLRILPPKPVHVCIDIVKESWNRVDKLTTSNALNEELDVYWMDVVMENGWETCMA